MEDDREEKLDDLSKEEFKFKPVGRGLRAQFDNPEDPQWYLADSDHYLAPFPGNALKWESFVYDDGTSYEGLTRENIPHGKGVMVFGTGTGAGIQTVNAGDKYEGEFFAGFANGMGAYTSVDGEVYRGEWLYGKRHGCGALTNFAPYFRELKRDSNPATAWKRARSSILDKRMKYGRWVRNRMVSDIKTGNDNFCRVSDVMGILQEMESVVTKARMFQHKPDGDATHVRLRDKSGTPVPVFQDPMHYPHGTKFLAPGPLGQCYPIPDNRKLKNEMRKHARNYMRIYNQYNLPYLAKPGDDLFAAARLQQIQDLKDEHYKRIASGEDEDSVLQSLEQKMSELKKPHDDALDETPEMDRPEVSQLQQAAKGPLLAASRPGQRDASDEDIDESDLVASTSFSHGFGRDRTMPPPPPSIFCSISGQSVQFMRVLQRVGSRASQLAPRVTRRQALGGPGRPK